MFNGADYPKALDEEVFTLWLENGRQSRIGYQYLLVIWDEFESAYRPVYVSRRDDIGTFDVYKTSAARESLVAAYDLYSESRIV